MELITLFRIGRRWVVTGSSNPVLRHFDNREAAGAFARELAAIASRSVIRVLAKDGSIESREYLRDGAVVLRDASSTATSASSSQPDSAVGTVHGVADGGSHAERG
jgi:hypothetical protein